MSTPKHWNSLQTLATKAYLVESNLRSMISSPAGITTLWVLVEGEADPYFYERMFDMARVQIVKAGKLESDGKVHGGYKAVKEIVGNILVLGQTPLIIGIIDRDWRPFKKGSKASLPNNIFETDFRDLEMTLLSFPNVQGKMAQEVRKNMNPSHLRWFKNGYWRKRNGDWFRDVWEQCCKVSRYMGSLRIVSAHYGLPRVDFAAIIYWDEPDHKLCSQWEKRLFTAVTAMTHCSYLKLLAYCWIVRYQYNLNRRKIYDVCRGHDFLSVLSSMLIDKSHFSESWMTYFMSREVELPEIRSLRLYNRLSVWMASKGQNWLN